VPKIAAEIRIKGMRHALVDAGVLIYVHVHSQNSAKYAEKLKFLKRNLWGYFAPKSAKIPYPFSNML
jgi:hypothetical protein